nr:ribonuclease H-like domain-containing protein [Tanacetum cinerariifolium]
AVPRTKLMTKAIRTVARHITSNISYLSDYEPFDGAYVSFGQGGCKITGKGTIKTSKMEFENVYFVKDLKTPRQHNMYSIDLNNIVPHRDITCLVAKASADELTDDFSRFTWTFFLKSKDETSGILKKFITVIENLKDLKVKVIRCDNEGEFRNKEMNDFCSQKGIKREFSNARTPQQNGVAKRRNRTLIEAARTMVLVNKSHNKTPYELFNGRSPAIGFLKPFGCLVMILNTLDNLGMFEEKSDEGYFIGYSMFSKAFRVFNKRTRMVQENLHLEFLENKAIEKGSGPNCDARLISKRVANQEETPSLDNILSLTNWFEDILRVTSNSDESNGGEADISNMETAITTSHTPTLRIHKDHPKMAQGHTQKEGIDYDEVFAPVDPKFPAKVYKVEKAMYRLHQAPRAWYGTLLKYLLKNGFQRGKIDQTLFIRRHQLTPKECHLHAVKRIFRYLKGHPKLGLWYPKESPFDLVAYSDSDYGGATQDHKSTTGGCQFLGRCYQLLWTSSVDSKSTA